MFPGPAFSGGCTPGPGAGLGAGVGEGPPTLSCGGSLPHGSEVLASTSRVWRHFSWQQPQGPGLQSRGSLATPNCRSPRRVALLEDVNRMSPSALAIIFAPCLLRCPDNSDPLTSMKDVLKVTT